MRHINLFENWLNEMGPRHESKQKLRGEVNVGDLVVALFFDSSKSQYNTHALWERVIEAVYEHTDCDNLVDYCATNTVCEFIFEDCSTDVSTIKRTLQAFSSDCTNMDVYYVRTTFP